MLLGLAGIYWLWLAWQPAQPMTQAAATGLQPEAVLFHAAFTPMGSQPVARVVQVKRFASNPAEWAELSGYFVANGPGGCWLVRSLDLEFPQQAVYRVRPWLPVEVQQLSALREVWSLQPRVAEQVSRLQESMLALGMLLAAAGIAAYVRRRLSGQTESEVGRGR